MTGAEKLRKENQALRNEIEELKTKLQKVSDDLSKNQHGRHGKRELSPDEAHSIEFISGQYDDFIRFKEEADKQIRELISIICKFVRRLTREKVMAARRRVSNLNADDLGFNDAVDISHINLFDHLTPRMQELLSESKKFKDEKNYKYCWAKNGFVYLRKTDTSTAVKLSSLEDLQGVLPQS